MEWGIVFVLWRGPASSFRPFMAGCLRFRKRETRRRVIFGHRLNGHLLLQRGNEGKSGGVWQGIPTQKKPNVLRVG